jgi:hypothetical protein
MGQKGSMMEYNFTLTGTTPILLHHDDVEASDDLKAWRQDPKNQSVSVPGDDRSPPWTWQTYLYHDGTHIAIPQQNVLTALRFAGAKIKHKGTATFKSMSQSGLLVDSGFFAFTNHGKRIAIGDILAFRDEPFAIHKTEARELGFELDVKRAKVGSSKHVRVRPRFDFWQVTGKITVIEPAITPEVLAQMFEIAGRFAGLCDWRPSSKVSPGHYGMFKGEVTSIKAKKSA